MIGLVALRAMGSPPGVDVLRGLPSSPATMWTAFLVGVGPALSLEDVLLWATTERRVRPFLPIGIVGDLGEREKKVLDAVGAAGLELAPVLEGSAAPGSGYARRERGKSIPGRRV